MIRYRKPARAFACLAGSAALLCASALAPASAFAQVPYDGSQDLRPTFMGTTYDIAGGAFDGKRGYLFRIWNRSGEAVSLDTLPDRFDGEVLGFLSDGASYSDGTLSFEGAGERGEVLFDGGSEILNPSPSGAFADRPANVIVVVEPDTERLVWTLRGRTATASLSASEVEVLELEGGGRQEPTDNDNYDLNVNIANLDVIGDMIEFSIEVTNSSSISFEDLWVSAYPIDNGFRIAEKDVQIGSLQPGTTKISTEALVARNILGETLQADDFVFAFDEQGSIEGLDLDDSGLRDDLEIMIDKYLTNDQEARLLLKTAARKAISLYELMSLPEPDVARGLTIHRELVNAILCVDEVLEDDRQRAHDILQMQVTNSDQRYRQKLSAMDALTTSSYISISLPSEAELQNLCEGMSEPMVQP